MAMMSSRPDFGEWKRFGLHTLIINITFDKLKVNVQRLITYIKITWTHELENVDQDPVR